MIFMLFKLCLHKCTFQIYSFINAIGVVHVRDKRYFCIIMSDEEEIPMCWSR